MEKAEPCDKQHRATKQGSKNDTSGRLSEYVMDFQHWQQKTLKKTPALAVVREVCCQKNVREKKCPVEEKKDRNRDEMSNATQKYAPVFVRRVGNTQVKYKKRESLYTSCRL